MPRRPPHENDSSGRPIFGRNEAGEPICNAILTGRASRGTGARCQRTQLFPNGRCASHGGRNTGRPVVHGGRSAALAGLRLAEKFAEALADPELASHRENIATLQVLINERLDSAAPTAELWNRATILYREAMKGSVDALKELGPVLEQGADTAERIDQAARLMDEQRKHKVAEARREADLEMTMTLRQGNAFVAALVQAVEEELPDAELRRRIGRRLSALLGGVAGQRALPG